MAAAADEIRQIVEQVLKSGDFASLLGTLESGSGPKAAPAAPLGSGVFADIDGAVQAATAAQRELSALPLDACKLIIEGMRRAVLSANDWPSSEAVSETGLGNVLDKQVKNTFAATRTPGVQDVEPSAFSDEHGLTITERAPYGVIGAITPVTNPIATITSNSIGMVAAGNSVVFNVHPNAKRISNRLMVLLNAAIKGEGGPQNLLCAVADPTIETAGELMKHRGVALLVVTGGPGVVKAAMASGKKAICAGPGNPPCVVDQTADLAKAGRDIVAGASFDNNVVCICEKEVFAVASIADRLKEEMKKNGAFELTGAQVDAVSRLVITQPGGPSREGAPNKSFVGKDAQVIAEAAGIEVPAGAKLLLMEVGRDHPLVWTEQLMPVLPLVRVGSVDEAIELAVQVNTASATRP